MQKAYLVIGNSGRQLIDAEEVNHSDFSKIFQCPECNATLHWRSSFVRDGYSVRPSFVHPKGNMDDCSLRVDFGINANADISSSGICQRGQARGKLEISFLKCLHYYQSKKIIDYEIVSTNSESQNKVSAIQIFLKEESLRKQIDINSKVKIVHSDPFLLIQSASKVLESSHSYVYLENKILRFEQWLSNNAHSMSYVVLREQEHNKNLSVTDLIENTLVKYLIKRHCKQLIGIIRYIQSSSDEMRRDFLAEVIWGDPKLPIPMKNIWSNNEAQFLEDWLGVKINDNSQEIKQQREPQVIKISRFSADTLRQLCEDPHFMDNSFLEMDTESKLSSVKFIKFVLSKTWQSVKFCDWSSLPEFYI